LRADAVFNRRDLQVPVFESRAALRIMRGIKAFSRVSVIQDLRGVAMEPASGAAGISVSRASGGDPVRRLKQAGLRIARKGRTFGARTRRLRDGGESGGIRAGNVVWIFGSARTGSTWLAQMMEELEGQVVWREPLVGALFGNLYYDRAKHLIGKAGKHYILGDSYRDSWLGSIRTFVLHEATDRFPEAVGPDNYLVIKEPNGSAGAPLLMEAMPESRMILLVRDPRDAVASSIDAKRQGGWQYENRNKGEQKQEGRADKNPNAFVRMRAVSYMQAMESTKRAYDAHKGRKVLVRYEELRADAVGTMRRIYSSLEIAVNYEALRRAVEKHSWENIPEDDKGEGKFYRKATPGGWREDLTPKQVEIVERVTAPLLDEFYPDGPR
jgi:hypothetical protein